ncbi:MAG TPA: hypothetical protein PL172_04770 [Thermomicrobiales bacterium]|nr:hypothetical protein [Thermomicrobiales bacterium]
MSIDRGGVFADARAHTLHLSAKGRPAMGDLYWGDNLDILRGYVASDSVDLIYLRVLSSRASAKHLLPCWMPLERRRDPSAAASG